MARGVLTSRWVFADRKGGPRGRRSVAALVMAGFAPIRVISFLLLAACGALCQQRQDEQVWNSLPDAPSAELFRTSVDEERWPLTRGAVAYDAVLTHESEQAGSQVAWISFRAPDDRQRVQKDSSDFVEKYLYSSLLKRNLNYHPSTSGTLMGRATYAASSIFVTRDDSGRHRLNTSYFVGVLSSAVIHTAYRPYWRRSVSEPFSDFGSNIGNDAGMNLAREFGPGIQQLVKSHAPKFIAKIEERISHN